MTSSSLTVGPAQGDLLLRTTAEGRAARLGHDLTLRVTDWQCVVQVEGGTPTGVRVTMDLGALEVLHGEGGVKPLTAGDKRKIVEGAAKTLGDGRAVFTTTSIEPSWTLAGSLVLHGVTRPCRVEVTGADDRWVARTSVRQTDFGITPYSQAMGSLRVGDVVEVLVSAQL
jgi:polyisoprenoid-binding protein YceI